jgi:tRNA pseudouridine55 synthase
MDDFKFPLSVEDYLNGTILLVDKPYSWSSFQALNAIKWTIRKSFDLKKIKVGHAGTLDPLATGLLILCTGKSTSQIQNLQGMSKTYTGTIHLGATTASYDLESEPGPQTDVSHLTTPQIEEAIEKLTGEIRQRPPVFSALKKDGKRLYEYARTGQEIEVPERTVMVTHFSITRMALPEIEFSIDCSKGTYIRSLAHDLGQILGVGGYLSSLRRTKIGDFSVDNAVTPEVYKEYYRSAGLLD